MIREESFKINCEIQGPWIQGFWLRVGSYQFVMHIFKNECVVIEITTAKLCTVHVFIFLVLMI